MTLKIAEKMSAKEYAEGQFKDCIESMTDAQLKDLSDTLRANTLAVTIEKVKRIGIEMCCTSTDINKPITINIPGVGECRYTGD